MKTLRFHAFGGSGVLKMEDLPRPELGEEELLVKVMAASVNPVDYKIREGKYPPVKADKLPYVPGRDIAGIVEACGGLVDDWKKGDAIFAMLGIERGGYAEYAIVKDSEAAPKPRALDFVAAASVPLAGLTAWQGLFRYGELKAGAARADSRRLGRRQPFRHPVRQSQRRLCHHYRVRAAHGLRARPRRR